MDFYFFFLPPSSFLSFFFFLLLLQTSPLIFPGIKNPFWIIHSILNLAGTCIHNKLNLPRRFWDLPRTCRWQTTKILFFLFFFLKRQQVERRPLVFLRGEKRTPLFPFFCFPRFYLEMNIDIEFPSYHPWLLSACLSDRHSEPFSCHNRGRPLHWTATHDSHQNRARLSLISSWLPRQWGQEIGQ